MGSSLSLSSPPLTEQTTLLSLPNELLLLIANNLDRPSHIHTLILTNRRLHTLLTQHLHSFAGNPITLSSGETLTALQWAAYKGHTPLIRLLLSQKVDINAHSTHTRNRASLSCSTPLHHAVDRGDQEAVRLLLHAGARSDIGDAYGDTVTHRAVTYVATSTSSRVLPCLPLRQWGEDVAVVRVLLDSRVDLGLGNNKGDTPLHLAVSQSAPCACAVARMLLENGAPVSSPNNYKYTPLHMASQVGRLDLVRVLLEWGADVTADGEWCLTPVKLAAARGFRGVVKVLGRGEGMG